MSAREFDRLENLSVTVDYGLTASATDGPVGPKFLRITDIQNDGVDWDSVPYCKTNGKSDQGCELESGDIVFARTGATTGKSFLIRGCPTGTVFASYLIRVRPNRRRVEPRYLARYFQTPGYWRQIASSSAGTAQPGVNATKLKSLTVPLVSLDEQRRIADILDKADVIRRKRQEAVELTENLLRATFLEMFGDPVANPKRWPTAPLGSAIARIEAGWSANSENRQRMPDEFGVLKVSAVTKGFFRPEEHKAVAAAEVRDLLVTPRRGDLLFSRANTRELVAATCLVEEDHPRLFLPDKLWRIAPKSESATAPYLRFLLAHGRLRSELAATATGTSGSMLNVSQEKVRTLEVPLPPFELQVRFETIAWRAIDLRRRLETAHFDASRLFESLVDASFGGRSSQLMRGDGAHSPARASSR